MLKQIFSSIWTEAEISSRYSYGMPEGTKKGKLSNITQEALKEENWEVKNPSALADCWHFKPDLKAQTGNF